MPSVSSPLIQVKNVDLWHDKGKASEVYALKNINLEIRRGEYVSFFGPSGCGKTTLLFAIAGIEIPQKGEIVVNNRDIMKFSKQELAIYRQIGVGIVFQTFNLIPSLTVADNVAFPMSFLGLSASKRSTEAHRLLRRLGVENLAERLPHELSGGQQQRVGIARALSNNPPIVVADEPLGNLDSANAKNVLEFLKELHEKDGRTIIMVTHEAWSLRDSERIFYMRDGSVVKTESAHDLNIAESISQHVYQELAPELSPTEVTSQALAHLLLRGYSVEEIHRLEALIAERVANRINSDAFCQLLDKPFHRGGLGLWRQRALKFTQMIDDVIAERREVKDIIKELEADPEHPPAQLIEHVRTWLLKDYQGTISNYQQARLNEIITLRLRSMITADDVQRIARTEKQSFGLGFSFRESHWITERLESIAGGLREGNLTIPIAGLNEQQTAAL